MQLTHKPEKRVNMNVCLVLSFLYFDNRVNEGREKRETRRDKRDQQFKQSRSGYESAAYQGKGRRERERERGSRKKRERKASR